MANEVTSLQLAGAIAKLFAANSLPVLRDNLVMGQLVNRDYDDAFANGGDTISISIAPEMVANDMAEAGTVQPQNPAYGSTDIVLNRHKEATFLIPDASKVVARGFVMQDYMRAQIIALSNAIEDELMNNIPVLTYNTPLGTAGTPISEAVIDAAETALYQSRIPATDPKVLLMGPVAFSQARQISRFTEARMIGGQGEAIRTGQFQGELLKGFVPVRSNRLPIVTGTPPTNYNLAFAPNAMAVAFRRLPEAPAGSGAVTEYAVDPISGYAMRITVSYNPQELGVQVTMDVLFGTAILRPEFGVVIVV